MSSLNDSMEKIRLCNEKIQNENIVLQNNIKSLKELLKENETDEENIRRYATEMVNALGRYELPKEEREETASEKVNISRKRSKFDRAATILAILLMIILGIINGVSLDKPDEWKEKWDFWLYFADVASIAVNCEIILHTGFCSKLERNKLYRVGTRVLYIAFIPGIIYLRDLSSDYTAFVINILSTVALIYTFVCNYMEYN